MDNVYLIILHVKKLLIVLMLIKNNYVQLRVVLGMRLHLNVHHINVKLMQLKILVDYFTIYKRLK